MRDKQLEERRLVLKNPQDLGLLPSHSHAFRHCSSCRQTFRLSDQASLTEEFVRPQDCDNGFLALLGYDGDFDLALSNIHDRICIIALRKDDLSLLMCRNQTTLR